MRRHPNLESTLLRICIEGGLRHERYGRGSTAAPSPLRRRCNRFYCWSTVRRCRTNRYSRERRHSCWRRRGNRIATTLRCDLRGQMQGNEPEAYGSSQAEVTPSYCHYRVPLPCRCRLVLHLRFEWSRCNPFGLHRGAQICGDGCLRLSVIGRSIEVRPP